MDLKVGQSPHFTFIILMNERNKQRTTREMKNNLIVFSLSKVPYPRKPQPSNNPASAEKF